MGGFALIELSYFIQCLDGKLLVMVLFSGHPGLLVEACVFDSSEYLGCLNHPYQNDFQFPVLLFHSLELVCTDITDSCRSL